MPSFDRYSALALVEAGYMPLSEYIDRVALAGNAIAAEAFDEHLPAPIRANNENRSGLIAAIA